MVRSQRQPLIIPVEIYDAMISHCIKGSPLACFGILAGIEPLASAIYPLRNAAESAVRYESDPDDLLRAYLDLRERGLAIVAIYQCRPGNAAVPGPTDLRENCYGDIPRVIISLGDFPTARVWRLTTRYCEELDWSLQPQDFGSAPEDSESYIVRPDVERIDGVPEPPSLLGSVLSGLFWRRRPRTRIPIGDLRDCSPREPEPMWDPSLDHPRERDFPVE
jgi:[CysO sulfur-carrier protein]-S-L-cysteine hydrolase